MAIRTFIDQTGEEVHIPSPPRTIISLVPSQTELLHYLGLNEEVAGITKFCVHPSSWSGEKSIVGGTKNFSMIDIHSLRPDLIIGNKEENYREGIEKLRETYPVWLSDIISLEDSLRMIEGIGAITGREKAARGLIDEIQTRFDTIEQQQRQSALYLIWRSPWMSAGRETFINTILEAAGFRNIINLPRYPELTNEAISSLSPDYIFLSSEPYPFKERHINEIQALSPSSRIVLVDGEMFSWYGSRLLHTPAYLNSFLRKSP